MLTLKINNGIIVLKTRKVGEISMENKLKYYRIKEKLTLKDLADKTGLSAGYLSHLENGSRTNPSMNAMSKIAMAMNKKIGEVFFK